MGGDTVLLSREMFSNKHPVPPEQGSAPDQMHSKTTRHTPQVHGNVMEYINLETKVKISLDSLTETEKKFYRQALKKFRANIGWLAFDEFAFGRQSPIYSHRKSHLDVLKEPLFLALKDMSLQLGVQQGMIARKQLADKKANAIEEQETIA